MLDLPEMTKQQWIIIISISFFVICLLLSAIPEPPELTSTYCGELAHKVELFQQLHSYPSNYDFYRHEVTRCIAQGVLK